MNETPKLKVPIHTGMLTDEARDLANAFHADLNALIIRRLDLMVPLLGVDYSLNSIMSSLAVVGDNIGNSVEGENGSSVFMAFVEAVMEYRKNQR